MITVELPGVLTTIQDRGRFGYEQYGLSQAGAMDPQALQSANVLVGNDPWEAAFEITLTGPSLLFEEAAVAAVTGADFTLYLNDSVLETGRAFSIPAGGRLRFGPLRAGCRAYLAVAGGLRIPEVLGSRSTSPK